MAEITDGLITNQYVIIGWDHLGTITSSLHR
jgi:hypothetical protein